MFRLEKECINSPSLFLIEIRTEESLYQYAIVAQLKEGLILAESLKEYGHRQWNYVFHRQYDIETKHNIIEMFYGLKPMNASRYQTYRQDMRRNTRKTFLAELAGKELFGVYRPLIMHRYSRKKLYR